MTISDKLDYISNGKINKISMKYIIEIDQEFNKKDKEIERLNNIIDEFKKPLIALQNRINNGMSEEEQNKFAIRYVKLKLKELKQEN